MFLARSFFIFAVVSAFATANDQQLEDPKFYPYNNYLEPKQGQRQQMMTLSFIIPVMPTRRTTIEWTTSTSTIVCTKYTDDPCSLRTSVMEEPVRPTRRPARPGRPSVVSTLAPIDTSVIIEEGKRIMIDENFDDQFSILPSVVQRVESTKLPKFPVREARAADPQYMLMYRNQPQDIEPGFQSSPFKPMVMPINRRRPAINVQRQFFQNYWSVTRRSTIMEILVSTSTPVCSSIGSIPQCAIIENLRCDK